MADVRETSIKKELLRFMKNTSMKGVRRIVNSEFIFLKWTWIVAVLGFLTISIFSTTIIVMDYLKYSVTTSVGEREMNFSRADKMELIPSVLVCNLNPYSSNISRYKSTPTIFEYKAKVIEMLEKECDNCSKGEKTALNHLQLELTTARAYFQYLGYKEATRIGHQRDDFILQCDMYILDGIYKSKIPCNDRIKVIEIFNPDYFNCFEYAFDMTSDKDENIITGISLMLHLDNFHDNKIQFFNTDTGHAAGALVVIHEKDTYPIISGQGHTIPPGFASKLEANMKIINRQPAPYGNCMPRQNTTWTFYGWQLKYTQKVCISACIEQDIIDKCKCIDVKTFGLLVPKYGTLYPYCENLKKGFSFVKKHSSCASKVRKRSLQHCSSKCSRPCIEVMYSSVVDIAKWPLVNDQLAFYKTMLRNRTFEKRYEFYDSILKKPPSKQVLGLDTHSNLIENNVLAVDAYLSENSFTIYDDHPKTLLAQLYSQLGGVLNLWSGITFMLMIELLDVVFRMIRHVCLKFNVKKDKRKNPAHINENDILCREV